MQKVGSMAVVGLGDTKLDYWEQFRQKNGLIHRAVEDTEDDNLEGKNDDVGSRKHMDIVLLIIHKLTVL